ncbi:uncharacterized protein LOC135842859 isoform X2 [Planococcus citri]|uniref:uncharacterized protein LOC135842859 isoform X2 n=1 Tax=Planococcus citri TaxID=170843 RepID=UPI0031F9F09C
MAPRKRVRKNRGGSASNQTEEEVFYDAREEVDTEDTEEHDTESPATDLEVITVLSNFIKITYLENLKQLMADSSTNSTPSILVKCNWASNIPGKNIKDTVKICLMGEDAEKENEEELSDFLDIRNTVNFIRPNEVDVPTVTLKTEDSNFCIEKLVFYGDVKTVELFGNDEMYLSTVHGTSIQTSEEFNVYEYKISVKQQREITLKLVRLSNQNFFWIYAFLVKLKKNPVEKTGTISYENVENLLKDINISEAAKNCLNFMKASNTSAPNVSSRLSEMFKPPSRQDDRELALNPSTLNDLKAYIDYKFQILNDLIIMREKHFSDKLDLILEYVKSRKNKD